MELLGLQLQPASSARTELTFWLSTPFPINPEDDTTAIIPQGTEIATRRSEEEEEIVFTTNERLEIIPPKLTQLRREEDFQKNYEPRMGIETFYAFGSGRIEEGRSFYIGFDESQDISGQILQLTFTCEPTQATGIRREDPPLVWEVSVGDNLWEEVELSGLPGERDTTGGLNNPEGSLVIHLPLSMTNGQVYGRSGYWLRCRFEQRRPEQGLYTESPRINHVTAYTLGGKTWGTHAQIITDEILGRSNGEPGQIFYIENSPVLDLLPGETVEVQSEAYGEVGVFRPWAEVRDFSNSSRYDHHFMLDTATGQIQFGPAIRQPDGTMRQYGRVPETNREIRFTRYRYGGGTVGNVPSGKLQVLKTSVAYIDRVANLRRATGGRDQESIEEAKSRAQRELRAQLRAVTPEDYEDLARNATRAVARVKCNAPQTSKGRLPPGVMEILIVPAAFDALEVGDLSKLAVTDSLAKTVHDYLDKYRLLTTILQIKEPRYVGIKAQVEIVASEFSRPDEVRLRVIETLNKFISPLSIGRTGELGDLIDNSWQGWPFGRNLYIAEIFSLVQQVPGVKHVLDVNLFSREVIPGQEIPTGSTSEEVAEKPVQPVKRKSVRVRPDTLLCSLHHEVIFADLDAEEEDADHD